MKVKLQICKAGAVLGEGIYDVSDADSFGMACGLACTQLRDRQLAKTSSIGALMNALDEQLLDELYGAEIRISQA